MDHGRPTTPEPPRDPNAAINKYLQVVKDCMFPPHIVARLPEEQRREIENMDVRIKSRPRGKVLGEVTEDDTGAAPGHAERQARRDGAAAAARNNAQGARCRDGESLRRVDVCARNLGLRQENLRRTLVNLDAEIEPLFHVSTGDVIEGFPRTLREVDLLDYGDAVRILEAVGDKERGDLWTVVARVRRWAASE
ncbi:hypothetical protein EsDP_00000755 [Epichloe bromicola]|uniref:Uncharacterized protein n=1 Tax=Epichloe bromicola TaxID=79588 RepID=A0ABQ0CFU5_9HYPO